MVIGPALAGFLAAVVSPAWLIGVDALSFAVLAFQVGRLPGAAGKAATAAPVDADRSAAGLRLLRKQPELLGVLALTWFFNFLYGPAEVALPLHVTEDLHAGRACSGCTGRCSEWAPCWAAWPRAPCAGFRCGRSPWGSSRGGGSLSCPSASARRRPSPWPASRSAA
ncbi:hypothetical protein WKI68_00915 [Streptomyces sp. MS1.HAVA.3]|uniref:MFS transporter n=1 Tax=Streptomyces caledonius TaxID=3134107 RepID=A0ABU8TZD6_9ACTN